MAEPFSDIREIANLSGYDFETACRKNTSYAFLGDNLALCKVLAKYKMYVDTRDKGVTPHLIMDGFWETWLSQCLARIVKPGDVCIDAGANLGYYSLLMSDLCGKEGKTVAVEPNPQLCKILRMTEAIHCANFTIVEVALSDKEGEAELSVPELFTGSATIIPDTDPLYQYKTREKFKVKVTTLDSLVKELGFPKVDVIKIDVEGLEEQVFEGMKEIIANNPELKIIIEYSPSLYRNAEKFSQYLYDNFIVYRIKDVPEPALYDESDMKKMLDELMLSRDHTDLYLIKSGLAETR